MDIRGPNPVAMVSVAGLGTVGADVYGYGYTSVVLADPTGVYVVFAPGVAPNSHIAIVTPATGGATAWGCSTKISTVGQIVVDFSNQPGGGNAGPLPFNLVVYALPPGGATQVLP